MKMSSSIALAAVFIIGAGSAVGYQVHAQSAVPAVAPAATTTAVQTSTTDPKNTDGETADDASQNSRQDPSNKDGETDDDSSIESSTVHSHDATDASETENEAADASEVTDGGK